MAISSTLTPLIQRDEPRVSESIFQHPTPRFGREPQTVCTGELEHALGGQPDQLRARRLQAMSGSFLAHGGVGKVRWRRFQIGEIHGQLRLTVYHEGQRFHPWQSSGCCSHGASNLSYCAEVGGLAEKDVQCHQYVSRPDGDRAGGGMDARRTKIRLPGRIAADRRAEPLEAAPPDCRQIAPLGSGGGVLVKEHGNLELAPNPLSERPGKADALVHRSAGERHEWHHVHRAHPRVLSLMPPQIDAIPGFADGGESRFCHWLGRTCHCQHRAVVPGVGGNVEHAHAGHVFSGTRNRGHDSPIAALREVGHAFYQIHTLISGASRIRSSHE